MSEFQPTVLAWGTSGLSREELVDTYKSLEGRAVALFDGWENLLGFTPDDLAQEAMLNYHNLRLLGHSEESARLLASKSVRDDFINLKDKVRNNPQDYFTDDDPEPVEDEFDDLGEAELETANRAVMYFSPEQVDWLADNLTPREMEAVILVFESDLTHTAAARRMHTSSQRVDALVKSAVTKLQEVWSLSQ